MVDLAEYLLADSSYSPLSYDKGKTADFVEDLINLKGFVVVCERKGKIVGGMVGDIIQPWFSQDNVGIEHIVYMDPNERSGRDAVKMVSSWIDWCKENECKQIRPAVSTGNLKIARLYEAFGFTYVGPNYVMNV